MPAAYQGTLFRGQGSPLLDLATPAGVSPMSSRPACPLARIAQNTGSRFPGLYFR